MSEGLHYGYMVYGAIMIIGAVIGNVRKNWTAQSSMLAAFAGIVAITAGAERSFSIGMTAILLAAAWGFTQLPRSFGRRK